MAFCPGFTVGDFADISSRKDLTNGTIIDENFSTIVIMELLLDLEFDTKIKHECLCVLNSQFNESGIICFFADKSLYPGDVDTTALALYVLKKADLIDDDLSLNGINEIINNTTTTGIIDVYFDQTGEKKNRIDPVVCANALYALSLYKKEAEATKSLDFVYETLVTEAYCGGTRYYPSEDAFLFAVSRLIKNFPKTYEKVTEPLKEKVAKRIGLTENPLDLAMRVIACNNLGILNPLEKAKLISYQLQDGSWPACCYFIGSNNRYFGSKEISTAFAIKALSHSDN